MSVSYDKNFGLADSDCNVGEEGIYKPKFYVETSVLGRLYEVQGELLFSLFPKSLIVLFNSSILAPPWYRELCKGFIHTRLS